MAIYYLKYMDADETDGLDNFYGFKDDFDGFGVFISTLSSQPDRKTKAKLVSITSKSNDGTKSRKHRADNTVNVGQDYTVEWYDINMIGSIQKTITHVCAQTPLSEKFANPQC